MLFFKKVKLEKALMAEIKSLAGVSDFPLDDAKSIARLLGSYDKGKSMVMITMMSCASVLEKYPDLYQNWDDLMIKYKKLGLFPNWDIVLFDD